MDQEFNGKDNLIEDRDMTLMDEVYSNIPKRWQESFKFGFFNAYEKTPASNSNSCIMKWDFNKKFYDFSTLPKDVEYEFIRPVFECLKSLHGIKDIDPLEIVTPNLRVTYSPNFTLYI